MHLTTLIKNVIKDESNYGKSELEENRQTKPSVRYRVGQSMDAIWAVRSLGIDPGSGKEVFLETDGKIRLEC